MRMHSASTQTPPKAAARSSRWKRIPYQRLTMAVLIVGLACRGVLYLLNHPLYMDEAFLLVNLLDRDYLGLTEQLEEQQVAPVLFLWTELAMFKAFGPAEAVLRFVPFVAGVTGFALFYRLARQTVRPPAAALAVGLMAVSRWPLHMTCQVKPYSLDLLTSCLLLSLSLQWLRRPDQIRWLVLLVIIVPIVIGASYPSLFVAAAVGVVLLPVVVRQRGWSSKLLLGAYGGLLTLSFVAFDLIIGGEQLGANGDELHDFMIEYWNRGFPPDGPTSVGQWLMLTHVGPLTGYPYGNGTVPGLVTFPLMLVGAWTCWRRGRGQLMGLLLLPFAFTLVAAFLEKYPYGGCTRLSQHLAPAVCLLAGAGVDRLGRLLFRSARSRGWLVAAICGFLVVYGVGLIAYWVENPFRDSGDLWARTAATAVLTEANGGDVVVCSTVPESGRITMTWYLRVKGLRVFGIGDQRAAETLEGDAFSAGWVLTTANFQDAEPPAPPDIAFSERRVAYRASFPAPAVKGKATRLDMWKIEPGGSRPSE